MPMEPDEVVSALLRGRLRLTAAAAAVVRDVHAADDLFQQVVLAAIETRVQFRDADHLFAWGLRAVRHRAVDLARRRKLTPLPDHVLDLLEGPELCPDAAPSTDRADALHRCMDRLGDQAKELIRLRYDEGLSAAAIAGRLRRTADAVYQSLSRVHRALRQCAEKELAATLATRAGEARP